MSEIHRPAAIRYGLAVVAMVVTLAVAGRVGQLASFLIFFTVVLSAWYGGLGPGLVASTLFAVIMGLSFKFGKTPATAEKVLELVFVYSLLCGITLLIEALHSARDRAEQNAAEARRHEQALRQADRHKDEFIAMLGHELRSPLAAISSAAELLQATDESGERRWSEEVIQRQTRQISRLVDDLLDISRISSGKLVIHRQPTDLRPIVERAVDVVRPLVEEREQSIFVELESRPLPLDADPARVEQILVNLLTNAAKYTGPNGKITLNATRDGAGQIVIRITDNGVGIDPEMLGKVFDLFTQVDRTLDQSRGGLGLGLTLVRRLVELHGGQVAAHSEGLGRGSQFVIRLPTPADERRDPSADVGGRTADTLRA
jgi:signal transduction histidine kinase